MTNSAKYQRLVVLVRTDQKKWLYSKVAPLRSLADVVRDLIDEAMTDEK
jgi:hypothetical protein